MRTLSEYERRALYFLECAVTEVEKRGNTERFQRLANAVNLVLFDDADASGPAADKPKKTITPGMSALEKFQCRYGITSPNGRKNERASNMDATKYLTETERLLCEVANLTADEYLIARKEAKERAEQEEIAVLLESRTIGKAKTAPPAKTTGAARKTKGSK